MIKGLLAAGHGGGPAHNRGAICYNEGDNNYLYSLALKEELETYEGIKIDLVRNNINENPHIHDRAKMGEGYDFYYAIHSNATKNADVRGTEYFDSVERPNMQLAKLLCDSTAEYFKHNNRGVKYKEGQPGFNWYGELRFNTAKISFIGEMGFHTNKQDCKIFKSKHKELAVIQARAIASYYNLKKKAIKTPDHWGEKHFDSLNKKGITVSEKRFDDNMTRAEVFALLDRIIK